MKNKYGLVFVLCFPIIILLSWNVWLEGKVRFSPEITVAAEGYDPRNLISGHHLQLRPVWEKTDCSDFEENKCPLENFERVYSFYLPEQTAEELDRIIRTENPDLKLVFSLPENGRPLLKKLLIEGQPWEKWLDNRKND